MIFRLSLVLFTLGVIGVVVQLNWSHIIGAKAPHPFDLKNYSKAESDQAFPLVTNCSNAQVGYLNFTSKVLVHEDVLSIKGLKNNHEEIVQAQLRYFDGLVDFDYSKELRFVPHHEKKIKILSVKNKTYPLEVKVDKWDAGEYPAEFFERSYKKGAGALDIEYEAKLKVTQCSKQAKNTYEIVLPLDPYLAYWYVPESQRVNLTFSPEHSMITTPCAATMMAELKHPSMYWNVWKPKATVEDFSCSQFLQDEVHVAKSAVVFKPLKVEKKKLEYSFLKDKEKINISLINGTAFPDKTSVLLDRARPLLKNINDFSKISNQELKNQDISVLATLATMNMFHKIANHLDWKLIDNEDHFIFETSGTLLHSGKPFEISIYLGPSVEYQEGRKHWSFLADALKKSDFIFYNGHAGMGTAFTVKSVKNNGGLKDFKESPSHQLIAILSCSSISYFGDDFKQERSKLGKATDLILTGFDNNAYRVMPAMIQFVDLSLAGQDYDLQKLLSFHLSENEDIHLTRD
jgi:hypothetical protein